MNHLLHIISSTINFHNFRIKFNDTFYDNESSHLDNFGYYSYILINYCEIFSDL